MRACGHPLERDKDAVFVALCEIARQWIYDTPNAPRQPEPTSGDRLGADVVRDFEDRITPHILRHWDRERIVAFAKHLLGDACQVCPSPPGCSDGGAS